MIIHESECAHDRMADPTAPSETANTLISCEKGPRTERRGQPTSFERKIPWTVKAATPREAQSTTTTMVWL